MALNRNNELNRVAKKRFISVLPMIGAGLLAGGAIAGSVVSIVHVAKKYEESTEFSKSVSARIKIDPVAFTNDQAKKTQDKQYATDNAKLAAERLSSWLKEQGQESYDVQYELEKPSETSQYYAYLTAKFKQVKVASKLVTEDDKKINQDPFLSTFDTKGFNTNNKTLVYRWYNNKSWTSPHFSVVDFSDLFTIPEKEEKDATKSSASIYESTGNKPGIAWKVKDPENSLLRDIYVDMAKAKTDNDSKPSTNEKIDPVNQPRLYIINNLSGMVNEFNYHISNYSANRDNIQQYVALYKDTDYEKFAKEYYGQSQSQEKYYHLRNGYVYKNTTNPKDSSPESVPNADALAWIDKKTLGQADYKSFMGKYVEDIITMENFTPFFPEKIRDDVKNTVKTNLGEVTRDNTTINHFWHAYSSNTIANNYINTVINKSWKNSKVLTIDFTKGTEESETGSYARFLQFYSTREIDAKFTKAKIGSNIIGALSVGFLIFLVALGIILMALYRTTGMFSWIAMMFMLSMSGLIAVKGVGMVLSMSLFFGLFVMAILGFMTCLGICERMKRRLKSNEDTQVIVKKTIISSIWPSADISIIALIFGICFTYIAPLGLNPLGLVLIAGGFMNFLCTFLLNAGFHGLWFNNQLTINKYYWFGKQNNKAVEALMQGNNLVPTSMDATKLTFPYYNGFSKNKMSVTNKKGLIGISVLGGILIVCIILFAVLGFASSSIYHAPNCLVVTATSADLNVIDIVSNAGLRYTSYLKSSDGLVYYFFTSSISSDIVSKISGTTGVASVWQQFVIGSTNRDILSSALLSILIGTIVSFVYAGIRCNWTAFVPMLAGSFGIPLIVLGIAAATQIKFDEYVVLAFSLIAVVNAAMCISLIGSINSSWGRREGYNKPELQFIVNTALKNDGLWIILMMACYALFVTMYGISSPVGSAQLIGLLIIGFAVTCGAAPFVVAYLLYIFLKVRNAALRSIHKKNLNKKVINYDEIDEQGIEGLNQFTKRKPIPKDDPVTDKQPSWKERRAAKKAAKLAKANQAEPAKPEQPAAPTVEQPKEVINNA